MLLSARPLLLNYFRLVPNHISHEPGLCDRICDSIEAKSPKQFDFVHDHREYRENDGHGL